MTKLRWWYNLYKGIIYTCIFVYFSVEFDNKTINVSDTTTTTTTSAPKKVEPAVDLPAAGSAEEEKHSSLTIFFILLVLGISLKP